MKSSSFFPSPFLKASDLDKRKPLALKIRDIAIEEVGMDKEQKPVLRFHGEARALVLNRCNSDTLRTALGDETDRWIGRTIELYVARVPFGAKTVDGIRVQVPEAPAEDNGESAFN